MPKPKKNPRPPCSPTQPHSWKPTATGGVCTACGGTYENGPRLYLTRRNA